MAKKPAYRAGRDQAATAENVELLTGQRGDRLDKAVTFRELSALGLSTLRPGAGGVYVPGKNPDLFPAGQMEFPHAPVNVIANGAFHTVLVEWDPPRYRGHAHAEIWRAESNNQSDATLVGTSSANLFSDAIGKGATFYYWVRFVNGKDDRGPFQGAQGVEAATSRDVQDILDELQGKIEESHLAQALLAPIEQVPQLQLDVAILKPKVDEIEVMRPKVDEIDLILHKVDEIEVILPKIDEIEVIRPKVAAIEDKIPGIEQELAGLDERQKVAQELLDDAQQQLGMSSIELGLVQDRLNAKLDKYKGDLDSFRDAVFVIDPENGSMTMDAVNAVREEMRTSITEVHLGLDAVAGQIDSKADNVTVDSQGSRLTEAEQRINGLDASLSQTVTKGEFTDEQQRVTQIGQELNATKGELTQKATQQEVDEQGQRLANAESKLTVHADALSTQAQRIDGLQATVSSSSEELDAKITELARVTADANGVAAQRIDGLQATISSSDEELNAKITELARVTADADGVAAQRVSGLEVRASEAEGKILALEEVIESEGGITAGRFDEIQVEIELAKDKAEGAADVGQAAIDAALAGDERDRENRSAFGTIRTQQQVIVDEQSAQAKRITDMNVKFEGRDANTQARISGVEEVIANAGSALAQRIDDLSASTDTALDETTATIKALEKVSSDADAALALSQDQMRVEMTEADNSLSADIASESEARLTADEAISRRIVEVEAQFSSDLEDTNARLATEELTRASQGEALAQQISTVDAAFKAADTELSASLAESSKALADSDRALGERISTIDVTVGENSASITELRQAVVSNEESLSQRQDKMESEIGIGAISQVEGALTGDERDRENRKARGVILQQQSTLANQQEAQARTVEQLTAEFDAENAEIRAQITNEQLVRSTADEALAQKTSVLEAQIEGVNQSLSASIAEVSRVSADADAAMTEKLNQQQSTMQTADAELSSRINEEATTRADAVESLASQIQQVTANYQQGDQQLQGQITAESVARADAMQALGSQIDTVSAVAGSKNKTFFQATAPGSAMGTGDLWFDTANNNRPYRYSGTAWVATDDPRIAANAAAVQLQSQAIADLQNGAQAMWTAKASAGQITAGIGLIANSDGTSQVAISASQVFVFNPNSSTPMAPLFAIDNGQAVIAEAIIRKATIQIIQSEKITADYIKAGVSITTPLINGGQIDMGNAFMAGGAAGFGKGGPYGGWGWGWHSIIYSDGSIYTNKLNAEGGYVRNMTIGNCTIEQDCVVKGTVYADRIVGDVAAIKSLYMAPPSSPFSLFFNVPPANFARGVIVTGINIKAAGYYYGGGGQPSEGTSTCTAVFYMNGVEFGRESVSATGSSRKDSATASATVTLPAGVYGQFQVSILGDVSVSLVGAVAMVFKHGSATFG